MSLEPRRRPVPDDLFGGRLHDCFLLDLEVIGVVDHSVPLRTLTFRSPDLVGFEWQPGQDLMFAAPGDGRGAYRRYTIRRADAAAGTLDVDAVIHGDGRFAQWAANATPGDTIEAIGPRGQITLRADATHHLFVGDASALAVAFALAEGLPATATATAVLGIDGAPGNLPAPAVRAALDLHWVGTDDVLATLAALDLPAGTAAYVNGERSLVREATSLLTTRGVDAEAIAGKAYWRRDAANADHGEPSKD